MTGSDWVEMYEMASSTSIASLALLISIMSGYLLVAYLVGERLTRFQVCVINTLYVMFAVTIVGGIFQSNLDIQFARNQLVLQIPEIAIYSDSDDSNWPMITTLINSSLIIASLIFMWQVRHPGKP